MTVEKETAQGICLCYLMKRRECPPFTLSLRFSLSFLLLLPSWHSSSLCRKHTQSFPVLAHQPTLFSLHTLSPISTPTPLCVVIWFSGKMSTLWSNLPWMLCVKDFTTPPISPPGFIYFIAVVTVCHYLLAPLLIYHVFPFIRMPSPWGLRPCWFCFLLFLWNLEPKTQQHSSANTLPSHFLHWYLRYSHETAWLCISLTFQHTLYSEFAFIC